MAASQKLLIIRLSSFGDIFHGMGVPKAFRDRYPNAEIHWVTRSDFAQLLQPHPLIDKVWSFEKSTGLSGWLKMCRQLRSENFNFVYDAHNNLRSRLLGLYFLLTFNGGQFIRRSKSRFKRMLLFRLGKNVFEKPFYSQISFLRPLKSWGLSQSVGDEKQFHYAASDQPFDRLKLDDNQSYVVIAPSAAWPMKRWPLEHWKTLIRETNHNYLIIGGPDDHFCQELAELAPDRSINLAGKLKLIESCALLDKASAVVSADTGAMHAADLLGKPTLALIGPTAFGFPSHKNSKTLEVPLACRPCSKDGRGQCKQEVYQKCMVDITPDLVKKELAKILEPQ